MIDANKIMQEQNKLQALRIVINYYHDKMINNPDDVTRNEYCTKYTSALDKFRSTESTCDYFYVNNAFQKIINGDEIWINNALLFLEIDPFYYRSGYLKETLLCALKNAPFDKLPTERIRQLMLVIVKICFRREFKHYCKLANRVSTIEFEDILRYLGSTECDSSNSVKTRARYMLKYIMIHHDVRGK